jgi:hypothetical protein
VAAATEVEASGVGMEVATAVAATAGGVQAVEGREGDELSALSNWAAAEKGWRRACSCLADCMAGATAMMMGDASARARAALPAVAGWAAVPRAAAK